MSVLLDLAKKSKTISFVSPIGTHRAIVRQCRLLGDADYPAGYDASNPALAALHMLQSVAGVDNATLRALCQEAQAHNPDLDADAMYGAVRP